VGKVAIAGSINVDMILAVTRLPKPGETVLGGEFTSAGGGKGANQAVAAARAGAAVSFVARVGDDPLGHEAIARFDGEGIDTKHIPRDTAPTGVALIFVDAAGENCIGVASGANAKLSAADIDAAREVIAGAKVLLVQLETPAETIAHAIEVAHAAGVTVVLNPAPAQPLPSEVLRMVSVITPNRGEAEALTGMATTEEAAARLHAMGVPRVIVTLGREGVFVSEEGQTWRLPAHVVEPVDTTAAGDVFNGALAASLAEGAMLRDAVRFANAAAALSVQVLGAQPSVPYRAAIEEFLARA
jgi:ribokinase